MRQDQALHLMLSGKSVFLTGPAGSGKTYVLNKFIKTQKKKGREVAITASTGIAATHIGGTTIHSWSGLGIRDELTTRDRLWLTDNNKLIKRYCMTDVLIIDEVSMLHGKRLNMIDEAAQLLRNNSEPFGGMQVILTGDLFQLPPITRGSSEIDFVHLSDAWQRLNPAICYLTSQYRQSEGKLLTVLNALRQNDFDEYHAEVLQDRLVELPENADSLTRLYTHNVNVDAINNERLAMLDTSTNIFEMETTGRSQYIEQLQKSVLAPDNLELKVGAEVMFVANNFAQGFANGTRGRVVGFNDDSPVVELQARKKEITVERHIWRYEEDGKERATVAQFPLRLAWAITIHKSQGMSLDSALVDLSKAFTYGMGYVALSRVRSLEGLYLTGINSMALRLHPDIHEFDENLRKMSYETAQQIGDDLELYEDIANVQDNVLDDELLESLKSWRAERSSADGVPAYIIAHDRTLEEIARRLPISESELLAVKGFGASKLKKYGPDLLKIMNNHKK